MSTESQPTLSPPKFARFTSLRVLRRLVCAGLVGAGWCGVLYAATPRDVPLDYAYVTEPAWGGVTFNEPVQIVFAPTETTRAFVVERAGRVAVVANTSVPSRAIFLDLSDRVGNSGLDHGLLSLAFHPQYAENGYFYLWYSTFVEGVRANRLARFQVSATNPNRADPASETPLITQIVGAGGHDGGTLLFGSDGYLYLSLGDGSATPEAIESHQRIDRGLFGGVIRIDVDRRAGNLVPNPHPSVHPGTYSVPVDNPFVGATEFNGAPVTPAKVRTEFWAVGLRNPFRMAFDDSTGRLWCGDVGLDLTEEIELVVRGGNYGWDFEEGTEPGPRGGVPAVFSSIAPLWSYDHSHGASVIGGVVYRGSRYAALRGCYLFGDFVSGRIWALHDDGGPPPSGTNVELLSRETGVVGFAVDPGSGDILLADLDSNQIKRLGAAPVSEASARLVNASVRTRAGQGDETLIMGLVLSGTGSAPLLVRGLGPALEPFHVAGALRDPRLRLYRQDGRVAAENDDWGGSDSLADTFTRVGAAPLSANSRDAALLLEMEAGVYTAHVTGSNADLGIALAELYDAGPQGPMHLVNVAVRSRVGTGDGILIMGFVLAGKGPKTLLIRGVGPGLAQQGVTSFLVDPRLTLFHGAENIGENDNWSGAVDLKETASRVGAFPLAANESKDSALLVTLPPGVYTVHLAGVNGTTGVALLELYEVP